ncbi:MAG: hypothetical protein WCO60_11540 [Verrucomicrobiota bacterium]
MGENWAADTQTTRVGPHSRRLGHRRLQFSDKDWDKYASSSKAGAFAEIKFRGQGIALYAQTRSDGGMAAVSLDDKQETLIDCFYPLLPHHASSQPTIPIFQSGLLGAGIHTLRIRVTGNKSPASTWKTIRLISADILGDSTDDEQ